MSEPNWLQALNVGDKVAIVTTNQGTRIATIARVTPATIDAGNTVYLKKTGRERGTAGSYSWSEITPVTPEILVNDRRAGLIRVLKITKWDKLSTETLEAVYGIVNGKEGDV